MSEDLKANSPVGEKKSVKRRTSTKSVTQENKNGYAQESDTKINFMRRRVWPD